MPARTQPSRSPAGSRFARPGGAPAQRPGRRHAAPARRPAATRRPMIATRRKPQKTGMAKAIDALGGMLPGAASKKHGRRSTAGGGKGRTAGLAMLAGAAGLAMKNRGRLASMFGGKGSAGDRATQQMTAEPDANSRVDAVITPPPTGTPAPDRSPSSGSQGVTAPPSRPGSPGSAGTSPLGGSPGVAGPPPAPGVADVPPAPGAATPPLDRPDDPAG